MNHVVQAGCGGVPPSSSLASAEDSGLILCVVTETGSDVEFYQCDPNPSVPTGGGVLAPLLHQTTVENIPFGFSTVSLESKIYIVGGLDIISSAEAPSSRVSVLDTIHNTFQPGVRTLGGKHFSLLTNVGGKIYAFGNSTITTDIDPWAEVFDPISNQWDGLPYPPDDVIEGCVYTGGHYAAFYEKKNRIILTHDESCLCYFDIDSQSWGYYGRNDDDDEDTVDDEAAEGSNITFMGRPVIVEDTLYVFCLPQLQLFAYDLQGGDGSKGFYPVKGLEEATCYPNIDSGLGFLFHLGNQKMCLVWIEDITSEDLLDCICIHCLKFGVNKAESGELVATAENCSCYFIHNATYILDCFLMKPTSQSDTTSLDNAAVPCTHQGVERRSSLMDYSLEGTRHVRRLYVDGFSPMPNAQDIEEFFNTNTKGQNSLVSVVNIYINEQKKFAIVEMNSEESASEALKLDGSSFQKSTLKIRRPSDYTYWMDGTHSAGGKHVMENGLQTSHTYTKTEVKAKKKVRDLSKNKRKIHKTRSTNGIEHKSKKKRKIHNAPSTNGIEHKSKKKRKIHNAPSMNGSEHKRKKRRKIHSSKKSKKINGLIKRSQDC